MRVMRHMTLRLMSVQGFGWVVQRVENHVIFQTLIINCIDSIMNHVLFILPTSFFILASSLLTSSALHANYGQNKHKCQHRHCYAECNYQHHLCRRHVFSPFANDPRSLNGALRTSYTIGATALVSQPYIGSLGTISTILTRRGCTRGGGNWYSICTLSTTPSNTTLALEVINTIHTRSSIGTRLSTTIINIGLTKCTQKAWHTSTGE